MGGSEPKRIFIAIKIEPEGTLIRMLASLKSVMANEKIKWVDPENIHVTLAFLGDTPIEKIKEVELMLETTCRGFGQFTFSLTGTGVYKNLSNPRIIWTGIDKTDELAGLNNLITKGLNESGFKIENRSFRPHITLGRIKMISNKDLLFSTLTRYRDMIFQTVKVDEIILFESILRSSGPEYIQLQKFSLI